MPSSRSPFLTALAFVALLPATARAAGYGIYEQGPAAMGAAGAATASVADPSALFYNPARLVRLEGTQAQAAFNLLTPVTSFAGVNPYPGFGVQEEMERQLFFPFSAYVTHRPTGPWAVGVGINTPFGLGVDWKDPARFTGRHIVTLANLQAVNTSVNVAYAAGERWSVAAGGNLLLAHVELERRQLQTAPGGGGGQVDVAEVRLESDWSSGYGWNAALAWTPIERWDLGFAYRGKIIVDGEGDAAFTQIPTGDPAFDAAVAASLPPDQGVSAVLRFPAIWQAGAAFHPNPAWTLETNVVFTEWSLFEDLPLRFDDPSLDTTIEEEYDDTWAIRLGATHRLEGWTYRFGYYFEQEAAPPESVSPLLPDAPRHGITVGLSFPFRLFTTGTLDLYNLALVTPNRDTEGVNRDGFDGEYKSYVNVMGLGATWRW